MSVPKSHLLCAYSLAKQHNCMSVSYTEPVSKAHFFPKWWQSALSFIQHLEEPEFQAAFTSSF